jgi:uncharacterized membrane protein YhfC
MTFIPIVLSGASIIAVGAGAIAWWRRRTRVRWRWFVAGAGLWLGAVVLKGLIAWLTNEPVLQLLEASLPRAGYLVGGSLYIGVESAATEIGLVVVAALIWRSLAEERERATAIGVGAGGFEAALLGLVAFVVGLVLVFAGSAVPELRDETIRSMATPLFWLIGPVERTIAISGHVASRLLVLAGVARRRWRLAWGGAALFTLLDSIGGFAHVSGWLEDGRSVWWIELMLAPVGIASVLLIRWCYARYEPATG